MQLYEINQSGGLTALPFDPQSWPSADGEQWLDGVPQDTAVLLPLVAPLQPHPLLLEDLLGPNRTTLITRYDDTLYIEFPTTAESPSTAVPYIALLVEPGLILTIPHGPTPSLATLAALLTERHNLDPARLEILLIEILGYLVDAAKLEALYLRDRVYATSDLLDEDVDAVTIEDFAELRRRLRMLSIIAEDQHYCIVNLGPNAAHIWAGEPQKLLLRDLLNDTEYILRTSQRLEQRLDGLHDLYQLTVHDRTEARLRVLTVISVIILPLTLITGFFGMNFPDLYLTHTSYGQALVLASMFVVPAALLWFLRRRGWFD